MVQSIANSDSERRQHFRKTTVQRSRGHVILLSMYMYRYMMQQELHHVPVAVGAPADRRSDAMINSYRVSGYR